MSKIIAAIDPGSVAGIVIVALSEATPVERTFASNQQSLLRDAMYSLDRARLVHAGTIAVSGKAQGRSVSERRSPLFTRTRDLLRLHRVTDVVIERPADIILGGFKSDKRGKGGEAQDTAFGIGNHFGLLEAAALDVNARISCYQIRSHKVRGGEYVIGWMQRRETKCPPRERILLVTRAMMRELMRRPYDGVIRKGGPDSESENENVLMALGVLMFHCDRERGRV